MAENDPHPDHKLALWEHKRKHKTLSLSEKCDILKKLDRGAKYSDLAKKYNVGRATIYDIKKNRDRIENFLKSAPGSSVRQTMKKGYNPQVDEALYEWFLQERSRHAPINGELLRTKARLIYKEITGREDFRASDGWLDKFKKRYAIRLCPSFIRNLPITTNDMDKFVEEFTEKMKAQDLHPDQIFCAGECELLWRRLPNKDADAAIKCSDRLTVMPCANASGKNKMKLLVVGKSESPKCLNDSENNLPVMYRSDRRSRVTNEIFVDWYEECFLPNLRSYLVEQNLPEKALLILDNAMAQGLTTEDLRVQTVDGPIEVIFLPPNATSVLHPMDEVGKQLRCTYRARLLADIATDADSEDVAAFMGMYDTKAAIFNVASAWQNVARASIGHAWKRLWPAHAALDDRDGTDAAGPDYEPVLSMFFSKKSCSEVFSVSDVRKWLSGSDEVDKELINEENSGSGSGSGGVGETPSPSPSRPKVSPQDAVAALNTCLAWAEDNNAAPEDVLLLKRLQEKAFEAAISVKEEVNPEAQVQVNSAHQVAVGEVTMSVDRVECGEGIKKEVEDVSVTADKEDVKNDIKTEKELPLEDVDMSV